MQKSSLTLAKKAALVGWILLIGFCLGYYLTHREAFTAERLADYLNSHKEQLLIIYWIASLLRGFVLLPSTPLVIAGTLVFKSQPLMVLSISMTGIMLSSAALYYFSDRLGIKDYFVRKYPQKMMRVRERLESPSGLLFLLFWAFFPAVPTDLASCVAGAIRMDFLKFMGVVFVGELILCSACIYLAGGF